MTKEQQKFYDIKHYSHYRTIGDAVDYAVIVDHEKKEVVLQFEESKQKKDWVNSLRFLPWPLKLESKIVWTTHGYAKAYKSTKGDPIFDFCMAYIENPDYKLCIRGWSYGSAMAKIAARHFIIKSGFKDLKVIDELTTYADIKCFLNPLSKKYKNQIRVIHEYVNPNDFLAQFCVPFYSRDHKCKIDKWSLKKALKPEYYHTHYEEYDYSKYESEVK